eukprot:CAMPEP_0172305330 /NCGR_PEP_ID=MMETSP1058-20130122/6646_1 /TAXON_ID=83371 /ORGANISM="Detonula confervacea, Strain CCMP 353" /LENGTH=732 /DNA_ID=CAMNT_0013016895 /DNA_START=24 /DNA_END=2218 /DNA_ORIENTATION=+
MDPSASSPPKVKTPLPMIPVPQALETVLTETAKSLWFKRQQRNDDKPSSAALPSHERLLGRISTSDIKAPSPGYPNHNASIMDGYAVKTSDLVQPRDVYSAMDQERKDEYMLDFVIVGKVYAGDDDGDDDDTNDASYPDSNHRTAIYVTTGAVVPTGYDAVIPIEDTASASSNGDNQLHKMHISSSRIESVLSSTKPMTWIRPIGCDIPPEYVVLSKGETIQPVHMALLAQVGVSLDEVHVKKLPRVGVLSTGNELLASSNMSSGSQQPQGKIPDVNRPMLLSQLSTYGNCIPIDLGIVTDDDGYKSIARRLDNLLWATSEVEGIDVLITTGGISMGEKDIMEQVFVEGMGGQVHFGRMNMKPGKPTTFITADRDTPKGPGRKLIFALPGNPVSASVCTELLVRPCLDLIHDGVDTQTLKQEQSSMESLFINHAVDNAQVHEELMATITSDIKLDQGRPEYRRVTLQRVPSNNGSGQQQYTYNATGTGVQRSSRVLSLRGANGLMILPRGGPSGCGCDIVRKGMEFPVLLYLSLSLSSETCFKDSMHRGMWKPKQHATSRQKLALGVIICSSDEHRDGNDFQQIDLTLVNSLGGDGQASVVQRVVCRVDGTFAQQLCTIVSGPKMQGVNVIFVIVPTDPLAEGRGSGAIAFRAGLEVSHALRPILTKNAHTVALQVRKYAASNDHVAALFENVVGTVRDNSSVLITCSDRGLEGAVGAVKGLLGHLTSLIST